MSSGTTSAWRVSNPGSMPVTMPGMRPNRTKRLWGPPRFLLALPFF
jgi:hypothetical protein